MVYLPFAIVAVFLVAYGWWRQERRASRLRDGARERRLQFSRHDYLDAHRRYRGLALMGVGHSRRAWNTFFGTHEARPWVGFCEQCDIGFGGDRVAFRRCIAAIELPLGVEALCLPGRMEKEEPAVLRTPMGCMSFVPATPEAAAGQGAGSHRLYVRRPSAASAPATTRLLEVIRRFPADWVWEAGESVLMVASSATPSEQNDRILLSLLDAVAAAADELVPPAASRA